MFWIFSLLLIGLIIFIATRDNNSQSTNPSAPVIQESYINQNTIEKNSLANKELTQTEKETSHILYLLMNDLFENPMLAYEKQDDLDRMISKLSIDILRHGIKRVPDENLANSYLRNFDYLKVNSLSFIKDFEEKYPTLVGLGFNQNSIEEYVKKWIFKFRDDIITSNAV